MSPPGPSNGTMPQSLAWAPASPSPASLPPGTETPRLSGSRRGALVCLAAICVSAGAVAGLGASSLQDKQFAARAELVYPVLQEQPTGFLRLDRGLSTQLVLMRSNAVLQPVAALTGETPDELRKRVSATVVNDSEVIRVQVAAASPDLATTLTQQVVTSYGQVAAARDAERRAQLDAGLTEVSTALGTATVEGEIANLRSRQISLQTEKDALGRNVPYVVTAPYALDGQVSPRPALSTAAGALAGLLIAVGIGALQVRRWTRRPA